MALNDTIQQAVTTARTAVLGLLVPIQLERKTGQDADGKATYAAPVTYQALVQRKQLKLTRLMGGEAVDGPTITIPENLTADVGDRITLRDGAVAPISDVEGIENPDGGWYMAVISCGRPERGTLQS